MTNSITIEDVLNIKFLEKWEWSPDGRYIAYIWDDGGLTDLWVVAPGLSKSTRISRASRGVRDFAWAPDGGRIWYLKDGSFCEARPPFAEQDLLVTHYTSVQDLSELSSSPDGSFLTFLREGRIWLFDAGTGALKETGLPERCVSTGRTGSSLWNPPSERFAFSFRDEDDYRQIGIAAKDGTLLWRSFFDAPAGPLEWMDDSNLLLLLPQDRGRSVRVMLLNAEKEKTGVREAFTITGTGRGPVILTELVVSPDRSKLLFLLENDGWAHWYLLDRESVLRGTAAENLCQVTFGECEDFGHAGDRAAWWPDSSSFVFASNRKSRGERHLFRHYLDTGKDEEIVSIPGQNTMPKVSVEGKLAFVHCDAARNMDIWVLEKEGPVQVTFSMPPVWSEERQYVPEEISFESAGGMTIYGYLMKPRNTPPGERLPGLVWVHGGPIRQMRPGWHPMRSYALFHGFNQYLVDRGYVLLSVNFRGGIGYGRDFREALFHKMGVDDVADVCNAALYLKKLPYVDPERIGVWGLSYGGYMVLHCLSQRPEVFRAGVNIAGIWDFAQYTRWAEKRYGKGTGLFKVYLGGGPDEAPDLYRQASPRTFVEGLRAPFLNIQGTADANVDFAQMDSMIRDCVEHGKLFEVEYYPDEVHTFARKTTWLDAMRKIEEFLARHLSPP